MKGFILHDGTANRLQEAKPLLFWRFQNQSFGPFQTLDKKIIEYKIPSISSYSGSNPKLDTDTGFLHHLEDDLGEGLQHWPSALDPLLTVQLCRNASIATLVAGHDKYLWKISKKGGEKGEVLLPTRIRWKVR